MFNFRSETCTRHGAIQRKGQTHIAAIHESRDGFRAVCIFRDHARRGRVLVDEIEDILDRNDACGRIHRGVKSDGEGRRIHDVIGDIERREARFRN